MLARRGELIKLVPIVGLIWLPASLEAQFAGTDNISAYKIGSDGALTPIAGSPFPAGSKPDSVAVDSKGRFLSAATARMRPNTVPVYPATSLAGRPTIGRG